MLLQGQGGGVYTVRDERGRLVKKSSTEELAGLLETLLDATNSEDLPR